MEEEGRRKKERVESSIYNNILCRNQFACVFSLLDFTCMVFHVVLFLSLACVLIVVIVFFNLASPFPGSHGVMGFSCFN